MPSLTQAESLPYKLPRWNGEFVQPERLNGHRILNQSPPFMLVFTLCELDKHTEM